MLLRLDWCDPGLKDSHNLSLSYQLLSVLTFMLLTLEQTKAILLMSEPAKSHVIINSLLDPSLIIALPCQSLLVLNFAQIVGFVIKLLHEFVKFAKWNQN